MSYQGSQKFPIYNYGPTAGNTDEAIANLTNAARLPATGLLAYHGYKRTNSVGWAIGWAIAGYLSPLIAGGVAVAQGFGERKKS